jgi:hypothetical protein
MRPSGISVPSVGESSEKSASSFLKRPLPDSFELAEPLSGTCIGFWVCENDALPSARGASPEVRSLEHVDVLCAAANDMPRSFCEFRDRGLGGQCAAHDIAPRAICECAKEAINLVV